MAKYFFSNLSSCWLVNGVLGFLSALCFLKVHLRGRWGMEGKVGVEGKDCGGGKLLGEDLTCCSCFRSSSWEKEGANCEGNEGAPERGGERLCALNKSWGGGEHEEEWLDEDGEDGHGEEVGEGGGECSLRSGILSHLISTSFFGLQLFDRMKSIPKASRGEALESSIFSRDVSTYEVSR